MDFGLKGKGAVVTGASRGLGAAIADVLAGEGMDVVLIARDRKALDEGAAALRARHGVNATVHEADLTSTAAVEGAARAAAAALASVDVLVNCAGATKRGDFFELTDADWDDGFALKFFGAMRLTRAAWTSLMASHGSIVNIIGVGGRTGSAEFAIGGSVNAAFRLFTKAMADRGVKDGVRVNAINPGFIKTERLQTRLKTFMDETSLPADQAEAQLAKATGVARFGEPAEIAAAVAFLASSSACGFCHGALLDIDGGQTRTL